MIFSRLFIRDALRGQQSLDSSTQRKNPIIQKFIPLSDFKLPHYPNDRNIYFGVGTRTGQGGTRENLLEIPVLWVDIDYKTTPVEVAREKAKEFSLSPFRYSSFGGGVHVYWLLREPATKEDIPQVESTLRRLGFFFYGVIWRQRMQAVFCVSP